MLYYVNRLMDKKFLARDENAPGHYTWVRDVDKAWSTTSLRLAKVNALAGDRVVGEDEARVIAALET